MLLGCERVIFCGQLVALVLAESETAVANAIADATGRRMTDLPMTPPRVLGY